MMERGEEEVQMSLCDISSVVTYWSEQLKVIDESVLALANSSSSAKPRSLYAYDFGIAVLLQRCKLQVELLLQESSLSFNIMNGVALQNDIEEDSGSDSQEELSSASDED